MSRQVGVKRRAYDPGLVDHAAEVVNGGGMSICQAAKTYKIPKTTLHDRIKHKYASTTIGSRTVLSPEEETRIEKWALHMSRVGYGRTREELAGIVQKIITEDGRKTPFVNNKPGRRWLDGFFTRHPTLNLRTTVQLGKERALISKEKVTKWFKDLESYVKEEVGDENLLSDPTRIYNADESGISLCQTKNRKVIGETGAPVVYQYGNSDKTQMTIMAAASASGHYIQPMIIYPGQRFSYNPLEGFEEAALGRSENGWMDSEVFTSWLTEVFIPGVEARQVRKPVLLLIDGHKTHVTMKASDICVENGIEMYCLLEHSSHLTQPLDLRLFGLLKQSWRQAVREFQSERIGEFVTKQTFARVFKNAWGKSSTLEAAMKGFSEAGIFPWNPQKVLSSVKLTPSTVFTEEPAENASRNTPAPASQTTTATESSAVSIAIEHPVMIESTASQTTTTTESPVVSIAIEQPVMIESTASQAMAVSTSPVSPNGIASTSSTSCVSAVDTSTPMSTSANTSDEAKSPFSKYLSLPKTEMKKTKVKRMIIPKAITGEKYRDWLKEKEAKKESEIKEKKQRQIERLQKRLQKAAEINEKKIRLEKKRKEREEAKQKRRELRKKKEQEKEAILRKIAESDSNDDVTVSVSDCYKCETPYDDFIQCTNCARRFHFACVSDELIDGPEELPFECKYC